jgi:hypothetical protein
VVGGLAVRTTSPFLFITHPVASTIGSGVAVDALVVTDAVERFSVLGLSDIQSTSTASLSRSSFMGLGGNPPRPVITKELALCLLLGLQLVSICCEASTRFVGSWTNPRLRSRLGVLIVT